MALLMILRLLRSLAVARGDDGRQRYGKRRLRVQRMEPRALLAGDLIGLDIDQSSVPPAGFTKFASFQDTTLVDLPDITGLQTNIDIAVNLPSYTSFQGSHGPLPASQIPIFDPPLNEIAGLYKFDAATSNGPFEMRITGLDAGEDYDLFVFGVSKFNLGLSQTVTISGATTTVFDQLSGINNLVINSELGDSSRTLESFAERMAADSSGEILVSVESETALMVGGIGIRSADYVPVAAGTIVGRLFNDANNNGVLDLSESGIVGETVFIDANDNGVLDAGETSTVTVADDPATTEVDESGSYQFQSLAAGTYIIQVVPPAGFELIFPVAGKATVVLGSTTGKTAHLGLGPLAGVIKGFVWHDEDGNGIFHKGEVPLSGRTVYLDTNDNGSLDAGEPTRVTAIDDPATPQDETGSYIFDTLPRGDYVVRQQTSAAEISTAPRNPDDVFNLQLNIGGGLSNSQREIFYDAAAKWESIITGDLPAYAGADDIIISASGSAIDGPSGILGSAGPRSLRPGSSLPAGGTMNFDIADLASLEASGGLRAVILHEMGHALGFTSSVWSRLGLIAGLGTATPRFLGTSAVNEYNTIFGLTETEVPIENDGGPGTAGSHWEESIFVEELMTGFYNGGRANPLSRLTIGAFADMGYTVDFRARSCIAASNQKPKRRQSMGTLKSYRPVQTSRKPQPFRRSAPTPMFTALLWPQANRFIRFVLASSRSFWISVMHPSRTGQNSLITGPATSLSVRDWASVWTRSKMASPRLHPAAMTATTTTMKMA